MNALHKFALFVVVLGSSAMLAADEPRKSDRSGSESLAKNKERKPDAKLLVGKWVRTDGPYAGTTMAFDKNGTYTTTTVTKLKGKPIVMPGTWKLTGVTLAQTVRDRGYVTDTKVTILSLTETELRFKNMGGQEATYERVAEKEENGKGEKKDKK